MSMLLNLKDQAELVIAINADDIEKSKVRGDLGITYDNDVLRLIAEVREKVKADSGIELEPEVRIW